MNGVIATQTRALSFATRDCTYMYILIERNVTWYDDTFYKGSSQKKKIADLRTYAELWGGGVQPNPH